MLDNGISDETDSDAFSPVQSPQASFAQTNGTNQKAGDSNVLLPHEQRRQRRLKRERLYLKHMTEQIKERLNSDCTIERIHQPSKETFVERYMKTGKPVILTGMMESWEATKIWNFSQLGKRWHWNWVCNFVSFVPRVYRSLWCLLQLWLGISSACGNSIAYPKPPLY